MQLFIIVPQMFLSFSALQRAENSSIVMLKSFGCGFICFSALQRAENSSIEHLTLTPCIRYRFSALQRAENSSIKNVLIRRFGMVAFQCSSASRKFLNPDPRTCVHPYFRPR